jgi:PKD repeat protein
VTGGNSPCSFVWDFGDGVNSTQRNASHTYANIGTFTVKVIATDSSIPFTRNATWETTVYIYSAPGPVVNLTATPGNGHVTLTWEAPVEDGGSPIVDYRIYRGTKSGIEAYIGHTGSGSILTYEDRDIADDKSYYYVVVAENSYNEGAISSEVVVKNLSFLSTYLFLIVILIVLAVVVAVGIIMMRRRKKKGP